MNLHYFNVTLSLGLPSSPKSPISTLPLLYEPLMQDRKTKIVVGRMVGRAKGFMCGRETILAKYTMPSLREIKQEIHKYNKPRASCAVGYFFPLIWSSLHHQITQRELATRIFIRYSSKHPYISIWSPYI